MIVPFFFFFLTNGSLGTVVVFYFFSLARPVPGLLYIIVIDTHTLGNGGQQELDIEKSRMRSSGSCFFSFFSSWKWAVAAVLLHQFEGGSIYI